MDNVTILWFISLECTDEYCLSIGCSQSAHTRDLLTVLFLLVGTLLGALVIADAIKPEAPVAVHALHRMGLRVILLTGDNSRTAQAIAEEVSTQRIALSVLYSEN